MPLTLYRGTRGTARLPSGYVVAHTHLAYASTAYGVQGTTTNSSHTLLSDGLDASGVYVGMTRGRIANRIHIVAADRRDALEQFTRAQLRDRADRGLADAMENAASAARGLVQAGPVSVVNAERARLTLEIEHAEQMIRQCERVEDALIELRTVQRDEHRPVLARAVDARALAQPTAAAMTAIFKQAATADGSDYVANRARVWTTSRQGRSAGFLTRRTAERATAGAALDLRVAEGSVMRRWDSVPLSAEALQPWAEAVARRRAHVEPKVTAATQGARECDDELRDLADRHLKARAARRRELTGSQSSQPRMTSSQWRLHAARARSDLLELQAIPVERAAQLLEERSNREALVQKALRVVPQPSAGRSTAGRGGLTR